MPVAVRAGRSLLGLLATGVLAVSCERDGAPAGGGAQAEARSAHQAGRALFLKQDLPAAERELRRALELDPGLTAAHLTLGQVLLGLSSVWFGTPTVVRERLDEAVRELELARARAPESVEAAYWLGFALAHGGRTAEAIPALERALELDPDHGPALKQLGLLHASEGRSERAKEYLLAAAERLPKDDEVRFQYGLQLEGDGDLAGARQAYEQAITLHPARPGLYSRLAVVCERLGDAAGAARASADYQTWTEFGKRLNAALRQAQEAPSDACALGRVGALYREAGMPEAAASWFQRVLELDPANAEARAALQPARSPGEEQEGS